ncbi:arginine deiminase family protein [Aminobacterium mobile]|uniref:arginine deiminase n=1 Tax=Aminobacterium mobile TaxID=81467 RepID=UPI00331541F6
MKIQVNSEIGKLRAVMMQSPGKGIERCTPLNIGSLAWDSVPSPHKAAEEHQKWVEVVERFGAKVYLFEDLLRDVLAIPAVKKDLIAQIVKTEQSFITQQTMSVLQEYLLSLPPAKLVDQLFFGMTKEELNKATHEVSLVDLVDMGTHMWSLFPMSNILYSRDSAAVLGDGVVFCKMFNRDRIKEPYCIRSILRNHADFKDLDYKVWYGEDQGDTTPVEGGNIHCYSRNVFIIGINERTHPASIEKIAQRTMQNGEITDVLALMFENPRLSSTDSIGLSVHVDMFLNMIDHDAFLFFPYIEKKLTVLHITRGKQGRLRIKRENSLFGAIKKVLKLDSLRIIKVGGDESEAIAFAEQRAGSGGNTFNLEPGKLCIWDRNVATIKALEKGGIDVVTIEADELVKGGGGPRCSTMPLWRDNI